MNKIDIFNANAEFFERFNNSLEDTTKDRHDRTRFTVTGLENKVEFAVTNAQGRIKKAEEDAVDRLNDVNGITNDELISNSVGAGKWMREGAYGLGHTTGGILPVGTTLNNRPANGFYRVGANAAIAPSYNRSGDQAVFLGWNKNIYSMLYFGSTRRRYSIYSTDIDENGKWSEILTDNNTRTDKNNVLHSGTSTPLTTLNTSDMAQEVVDRDDITVTSGAVYRVIQELRAEIALLKGKLNE